MLAAELLHRQQGACLPWLCCDLAAFGAGVDQREFVEKESDMTS
jgi:hypothetical protein